MFARQMVAGLVCATFDFANGARAATIAFKDFETPAPDFQTEWNPASERGIDTLY
jgi:hypothetical protein